MGRSPRTTSGWQGALLYLGVVGHHQGASQDCPWLTFPTPYHWEVSSVQAKTQVGWGPRLSSLRTSFSDLWVRGRSLVLFFVLFNFSCLVRFVIQNFDNNVIALMWK